MRYMTNNMDLMEEAFNHLHEKDPIHPMRCDIEETSKAVIVDVDVPSFKKENLKVNFNDDVLTISAAKNEEEQDTNYLLKERVHQDLERKFYFGDYELATEEISASYKNGTLHIVLPKKIKKDETVYISIR